MCEHPQVTMRITRRDPVAVRLHEMGERVPELFARGAECRHSKSIARSLEAHSGASLARHRRS